MKTKLLTGLLFALAAPAFAGETVTVYRALGCVCCDNYVDYLKSNGFDVTTIDDAQFQDRAIAAGVPKEGLGCHLAMIDGYVVSGLVPVEIINRLIADKPEITGITLPGMPGNAPGMSDAKTGTLKVYAFAPTGVTVYSNE
ncbi:MAG: DUF411 domain-containing protein [Paracoccaceae bacterium]